MEKSIIKRKNKRKKRAMRVRRALKASSKKPRLSVSKTNKHIFAQVIDDESGITLFGFGTRSKDVKGTEFQKKSKKAAAHIGALIAKAAKDKKIEHVIFDRGRCKYHGIISSLAEAARGAGLKF